MKSKLTFSWIALCWLVLTAGAGAQSTVFTYQGRLSDNGAPANGNYDLQFSLRDAPGAGNPVGTPIALPAVPVTNGVFTVTLDFGAGAFPGAARFLEIGARTNGSPAAHTVLSPRQEITSAPYAIQAMKAGSAGSFTDSLSGDVTGTQGATVVANVGGQTAANVASGASAANGATSANTANTIVKRNASGDFTAGTITAAGFTGGGANLTGLNASQLGSGTVPATALGNAWKLGGNAGTTPGTHFLGTTDNQPFEIQVNGTRVMRLEPAGGVPNVMFGASNLVHSSNIGSVIGGGYSNWVQDTSSFSTISGGTSNAIQPSTDRSTIGGGDRNSILAGAFRSTIAGGTENTVAVLANDAFIGGGNQNIGGRYAVVGGGQGNSARAVYSVAGGGYSNSLYSTYSAILGGSFNRIADYTGFHGVIVGGNSNFVQSQFGVIVGGATNQVLADFGFIGGGAFNVANHLYAIVLGGLNNTNYGWFGTIGGGELNSIPSQNSKYSTISGGGGNMVFGGSSTVGGGSGNMVNGGGATIAGGTGNQINPFGGSGNYSTIAGGNQNQAHTSYSTVGGGNNNQAAGFVATVAGGEFNYAGGDYMTISGGSYNQVGSAGNALASTISGGARNGMESFARYVVIAGGLSNFVGGSSSANVISGGNQNFIGGGSSNSIIAGGRTNYIWAASKGITISGGMGNAGSNSFGVIPGGRDNNVGGDYAFAAGRQAKANHAGAFVWADSAGIDFASTANDQFLIRAGGNVGINKNNPATALDVNGTITAASFSGPLSGNATSATTATTANNFSGSLSGDVTGTQGATVVSSVGGQTAANVASGASAANGAASGNTANAIVKRNASGDFTAGTITAAGFTGGGANLTGLNASQLGSGTVPMAALGNAWQLGGNAGTTAGTHFLGTTDGQPVEIHANGYRVLRLEPAGANDAPNIIGGSSANSISPGITGSVIAGGGGNNYFGFSYSNQISGYYSVIGGGYANSISGGNSTIAGGVSNSIQSIWGTIGGGIQNVIQPDAHWSTIGGGNRNSAEGWMSTIGGGELNTNRASNSTISGGTQITIHTAARNSTVGGGIGNLIETNAYNSTIGGGAANKIQRDSNMGTIGGGQFNVVQSNTVSASVGGGQYNTNSGSYSAIPGGDQNVADRYSFSAGHRAKATHPGSFVWADSSDSDFGTTGNNQFLIRTAGGVGINRSNPASALDVNGVVTALGFTGNVTGNLNGTAAVADNFNGTLVGDVTGTQGATVVSKIGGVTPTSANVANAVVMRGPSGNFTAGTITATLAGNASTATTANNFSGSLAGNVTGTQGATVVSTVGGVTAANVASGANAANAAASVNTVSTIVKRDASGNFTAGTVTASAFSGGGGSLTGLNATQLTSGTVPAAALGNAWQLGGNSGTTVGTQFLGTVDNQPLELKVFTSRALRLEANASGAPNLIGGSVNNVVDAGVVGATIAGGGATNHQGQAYTNQISADFGAIGGGNGNTIQSGSSGGVIGGGTYNTIQPNTTGSIIAGGMLNMVQSQAHYSVVIGGIQNTVASNAIYSVVAGGRGNVAAGTNSFAAGAFARALHDGAFVWGDATLSFVDSSSPNEFTARASGGVRFFTDREATAGVSLAPGDTAWAVISDRNAKKNFEPLDAGAVLEKLSLMPVLHWNYKWESDAAVPHIGPVAQDFKAAFYPGRNDKSITTLEFDGVELAAIQGLNQKLEKTVKEKDAQIQGLEDRLSQLEKLVEKLAQQNKGGE